MLFTETNDTQHIILCIFWLRLGYCVKRLTLCFGPQEYVYKTHKPKTTILLSLTNLYSHISKLHISQTDLETFFSSWITEHICAHIVCTKIYSKWIQINYENVTFGVLHQSLLSSIQRSNARWKWFDNVFDWKGKAYTADYYLYNKSGYLKSCSIKITINIIVKPY